MNRIRKKHVPDSTTFATGTPFALAMKPSVAKTTKPANTEVRQLIVATRTASLKQKQINSKFVFRCKTRFGLEAQNFCSRTLIQS